jgi:hypothetical protein
MASLPKRPTKKHVEYTSFETDAIIKGIKILGDNPGRWADIKRMFPVELAQRTPLQIRDRWFVVKKKLELNDPQGSTSQVLNMTATQQAPTALVPHLQPTQVQVQPIAPATLQAIQPWTTTALVHHLQPAQVQVQPIAPVTFQANLPRPTTALVHNLQPAQATTSLTCATSRVVPLTSTATVTSQGRATVPAPYPISSTTAIFPTPTLTTAQYLQLMTTIPNHITNPNSNVIEVLTQLLDDDDSPNHYTSVFGQYIATCPAKSFIQHMTVMVRDIKSKRPDLELERLMSLFQELDSSMSAINGMLCGKLRSCVLNFEVNDTDHEEGGASGWSSTFRVRKSYKDHSLAFGRLLVYLDHFKCPILPKYKILVSGEGYSQDRCVEQGLIAKLLFELTMEKVPDGDTLPIICCFALFDCFHIQHGKLKIKALNCMSKCFSSILYLMREGVVACASMMINNNQAEHAVAMIKSSKDQVATNRVSPWIRCTKELQRRIPKYSETMIDSDRNISYLGLHITQDKYSCLIRNMLKRCKSIFSVLFDGDDWKAFFDPSYKIQIDKKWYRNCNISATKLLANDPTPIHLHSLKLASTERDKIEKSLQELVSEIELACYGCSGGAERESTVKAMTVNQLMLHGHHLYFVLVHDKNSSVMTKKVSAN